MYKLTLKKNFPIGLKQINLMSSIGRSAISNLPICDFKCRNNRRKKNIKNFLISFLLCNLFIAPAISNPPMEELEGEYEHVTIPSRSKIPDAYRLITTTLPLNVFPLLPTGHRWVKEGKDYIVKRHRDASQVGIEFVVYADHPLTPSKVNYLTMVDGINVQSFFHTRAKTFKGKRVSYEFTVREPYLPDSLVPLYSLRNQVYLKEYLDGHCGDHADTIFPEYVNNSISSIDSRNHLPEPKKSYWGLHVRNSLVGWLRPHGGCYMQMPYYSATPPRTTLGTLVPEGVYFSTFLQEPTTRAWAPQAMYHIPWAHDIHSSTQSESWVSLLGRMQVANESYGYLPYVYGLQGEEGQWWSNNLHRLLLNSPIFYRHYNSVYDRRLAENIKIAADMEVESISYKLRFLHYAHMTHQTAETAHWHRRSLLHADLLFECQMPAFSHLQAEEVNIVMKAAGDSYQDHWRQVIADQKDLLARKLIPSTKPLGRKRYNLRSSLHIEEVNPSVFFHIVEFGSGKGCHNQIKNGSIEAIDQIRRKGQVWLKEVDKRKVDAWLECNKQLFQELDKSKIEIHYKPCTSSKSSWENIEKSLRSAGFTIIRRKIE